ncbi:MAG: phenylalanine--tRNA ligase subunit beta, partial [Rhodospirillales bacterium]|nr:phenylalanine--tRNA ligase subunit beta [Rhodospirillales bacterium]
EREMGLSDEHDGIIDLDTDGPTGTSAVEIMGLNDTLIEIAITPNRGDCLGVRGIARDLAASGLGTLKPLNDTATPGTFESPIKVHIDLEGDSANACPMFVGRYIRGVKNPESPKWLKDRLLAVGLRPISALVDITNLMTLGYNRPLHVFDADKVTGDIHVRMAKQGETFLALNDKAYTLDDTVTVIADEAHAEAMGGIMGGVESGCTETTTNVFVESAFFDPIRTATSGRKLNVTSDARYRFERGIDPEFLIGGMEIATQLILDLCDGEVSELVIAGGAPKWQRTIDLRLERIFGLGGTEIETNEAIRILDVLGFDVTRNGEVLSCDVPSWRSDIVGEADLVEEVVRVNGYDQIPIVAFTNVNNLPHPILTPSQRRRAAGRRTAASRGLMEAVTYSFLPSSQADLFGGVSNGLRLINPISADLDVMRPSLLPNLLAAAGRNADRGVANACLFEVGPQFDGDGPGAQSQIIAGIRSGLTGEKNWSERPRAVDAFDAKADALAILSDLGAPVANLQVFTEAPDWYHPGRSGELRMGPKTTLARFGEVHPGVLKKMGVKGAVAAFEILLENLPSPKAAKGSARANLILPNLQPLERDFAFVVSRDVSAEALIRAAKGVDKKLITDVRLFDVFQGGNLADDQKSIAINVVLQPTEQTLTDADIEAIAVKIVDKVCSTTGGTLRG